MFKRYFLRALLAILLLLATGTQMFTDDDAHHVEEVHCTNPDLAEEPRACAQYLSARLRRCTSELKRLHLIQSGVKPLPLRTKKKYFATIEVWRCC